MAAVPATDGGLIYLPMLKDVRGHLIGNVVLAVLSTITIALRLYGRVSLGYGLDDLLIVLAWMFSMSLVAESGFRTYLVLLIVQSLSMFLTWISGFDRRWV